MHVLRYIVNIAILCGTFCGLAAAETEEAKTTPLVAKTGVTKAGSVKSFHYWSSQNYIVNEKDKDAAATELEKLVERAVNEDMKRRGIQSINPPSAQAFFSDGKPYVGEFVNAQGETMFYYMLGELDFKYAIEPKIIDVVIHSTPGRPDYVDFGKATNFQQGHEPLPTNVKSFVITYQAQESGGDFNYRAGFYYELADELVISGMHLNLARIRKYPDLEKRYMAIRPTRVNFELAIDIFNDAENKLDKTGKELTGKSLQPTFHTSTTLIFKVKDLDLVVGQSGDGQNRAEPVVPLHWRDAVTIHGGKGAAFTNKNNPAEDEEIKKIFCGFTGVIRSARISKIDVIWPDEVIKQIAKDFDAYEAKASSAIR